MLWKIWNANFGKVKTDNLQIINGLVDPIAISEAFARYFASVCKPNSETANARLRSCFYREYANYVGDQLHKNDFFSVELVSVVVSCLNIRKAPGFDGLITEHLLHCHPLAIVFITYFVQPYAIGWLCTR